MNKLLCIDFHAERHKEIEALAKKNGWESKCISHITSNHEVIQNCGEGSPIPEQVTGDLVSVNDSCLLLLHTGNPCSLAFFERIKHQIPALCYSGGERYTWFDDATTVPKSHKFYGWVAVLEHLDELLANWRSPDIPWDIFEGKRQRLDFVQKLVPVSILASGALLYHRKEKHPVPDPAHWWDDTLAELRFLFKDGSSIQDVLMAAFPGGSGQTVGIRIGVRDILVPDPKKPTEFYKLIHTLGTGNGNQNQPQQILADEKALESIEETFRALVEFLCKP